MSVDATIAERLGRRAPAAATIGGKNRPNAKPTSRNSSSVHGPTGSRKAASSTAPPTGASTYAATTGSTRLPIRAKTIQPTAIPARTA